MNASRVGVQGSDIEAWLQREIGRRVGVEPDEIDTDVAFGNFGIESKVVVELASELGAWLGMDVSPVLVYEFTDIESLAAHLSSELG